MSLLFLMRGLPASGKTTSAEKQVKANQNVVRLNRDLLREMLHFNVYTPEKEKITKNVLYKIADVLLVSGVDVIVDDTNLNPKTVEEWKQISAKHNTHLSFVDMETDVETCIQRDSERGDKSVGVNVIRNMAMEYLDYMKGEKVVICDIDGTIADLKHRLEHIAKEPKDFETFYSLVSGDTPRIDIIRQVQNLCKETGAKLIFVTGRPERTRDATTRWLYTYIMPEDSKMKDVILFMRADGDHRQDVDVKSEIYNRYLKELDIIKVFDDRPCVIKMWKSKLLEVVDVGDGIDF